MPHPSSTGSAPASVAVRATAWVAEEAALGRRSAWASGFPDSWLSSYGVPPGVVGVGVGTAGDVAGDGDGATVLTEGPALLVSPTVPSLPG